MKNTPQTRITLISIALFFTFVAAIVFSQWPTADDEPTEETSSTFPEEHSPDHLAIEVDILAVNTLKGDLTLRLSFFPSGALADENGLLAKDLLLDFGVASGAVENIFREGEQINPKTVTLNLLGQPNDYPFDVYNSLMTMALYEIGDDDGEEYYADAPLVVELYTDINGYEVEVFDENSSDNDGAAVYEGYVNLNMALKHDKSDLAFTLFLMGFQWLLAFIAFIVTVVLLVHKKEIAVGDFGWLSALLFAQISLRNTMPNTPPVGTLGDSMSFFWVLGIIVTSMLVLVVTWLIQGEKEEPESA